MSAMKLPIVSDETTTYPDKAECPICKAAKVFEPHSFATICGGALLMDRKSDVGGIDEAMDGYLSFSWHGAHLSDGGLGKDPEVTANLDIARDCIGGQFELYFCSTNCLRIFLNSCVDQLEERIKLGKSEQT